MSYTKALTTFFCPWLNVIQIRKHFRHLSGLVVSASAYDTSGGWFESHSQLNLLNLFMWKLHNYHWILCKEFILLWQIDACIYFIHSFSRKVVNHQLFIGRMLAVICRLLIKRYYNQGKYVLYKLNHVLLLYCLL